LVIDVYPPGQGMGEGAGTITVDKLMVDNITVLKVADFNWVAVLGRPELTKVVIKKASVVSLRNSVIRSQTRQCCTRTPIALLKR
jgi:hypothetical protein